MPKIEQDSPVLQEALRLHGAGWWVVPQQGKRALALGWDKYRLEEEDLRGYLDPNPSLNIAVVLSRSEYMDVECDGKEAEAKLQSLCSKGELQTPTWRSRRGLHRLFRRPSGLPDKAQVIVDGIEFRIGNRGALSTVPPSVHPDDPSVTYEWLPDLSVWEVAVSPLPQALAALACSNSAKPVAGKAGTSETIAEGNRNDELFRYGCRLLRAKLSSSDVKNALVGCNKSHCRPPLTDGEVAAIAVSVEKFRSRQLVSSGAPAKEIEPLHCESWSDVVDSLREAFKWIQTHDDVFSVMLAVALSTDQAGSQLFLQVIGDPGSLKTRLCDAMLVSKRCHALEHLTGFYSGCKDPSGREFSLIDRINHKTLITPEGDVMMASPQFTEIMSQQRRIFDGTGGHTYKNSDEDKLWTGLRTPWIMAGTQVLLEGGQARLGDRFLKVLMGRPTEEQKQGILRKVGYTALRTILQTSDGHASTFMDPRMYRAYQMAGGYINWFRENAVTLLSAVQVDEEQIIDDCTMLADFTAEMRARPHWSKSSKEESYDTKELPTRLLEQYLRMSRCLAAVLRRPSIDGEVMRRVRKVAFDTAVGPGLKMFWNLLKAGDDGVDPKTLAMRTGQSEYKSREQLRFMERVGTVETFEPRSGRVKLRARWRLSDRVRDVYEQIEGAPTDEAGALEQAAEAV